MVYVETLLLHAFAAGYLTVPLTSAQRGPPAKKRNETWDLAPPSHSLSLKTEALPHSWAEGKNSEPAKLEWDWADSVGEPAPPLRTGLEAQDET